MSSNNTKGLVRLLRLMTEAEKRDFKADFDLADNASDDEVMETIEALPRYEAVRAFLRAGDPTLVLLREVFEILESFGIATRTTGCVFVLANPAKPEERTELSFSQQTVGAVCSWSPRKKWSRVSDSLSDLQSTWMQFGSVWKYLLRKAEPRTRRGRLDVVRTHLQGRMTYGRDRHRVDKDAQRVLGHFANRIEQLNECLNQIQKTKRPRELTEILRDARQLEDAIAECLDDPRGPYSPSQGWEEEPPDEHIIHHYTSPSFVTDFDKFAEDIFSLADLIRGINVVDMLQINVWSARPQLFEIWVLLRLLHWFCSKGYIVELLKTECVGIDSPFRWNLSYSKDSQPCAVVRDIHTSLQQFLFYQLYRPSGDMPDISLLEDSDPSSSPIWSVDPKHSEKGGYSRSDYEATAVRYRDSFGASLSLVVEYFDRSDFGELNPIEFGPGAKLISCCRPDGTGLPILLTELSEFHPTRPQVLVCIDFSGSFLSQREEVLERLRQRCRSGLLTNVAPECICFAGSTAIVRDFDKWLNAKSGSVISPGDLQGGTASTPLASAICDFNERIPISEVLLVTDGEFDIPADHVKTRIQDELPVPVTFMTP